MSAKFVGFLVGFVFLCYLCTDIDRVAFLVTLESIFADVLTTGATMTACTDALKNVEGIRVSILALAMAGG